MRSVEPIVGALGRQSVYRQAVLPTEYPALGGPVALTMRTMGVFVDNLGLIVGATVLAWGALALTVGAIALLGFAVHPMFFAPASILAFAGLFYVGSVVPAGILHAIWVRMETERSLTMTEALRLGRRDWRPFFNLQLTMGVRFVAVLMVVVLPATLLSPSFRDTPFLATCVGNAALVLGAFFAADFWVAQPVKLFAAPSASLPDVIARSRSLMRGHRVTVCASFGMLRVIVGVLHLPLSLLQAELQVPAFEVLELALSLVFAPCFAIHGLVVWTGIVRRPELPGVSDPLDGSRTR